MLLQSIIWVSYFNRDWQAPINYHKCIQTPVSQVSSSHVRYFYKSHCSKMQFKACCPCFKNPSRVLCTATPHGINSNCLVLSHKLLYHLVTTFLPLCLTHYLTCSKDSQTNEHLQSPKAVLFRYKFCTCRCAPTLSSASFQPKPSSLIQDRAFMFNLHQECSNFPAQSQSLHSATNTPLQLPL